MISSNLLAPCLRSNIVKLSFAKERSVHTMNLILMSVNPCIIINHVES